MHVLGGVLAILLILFFLIFVIFAYNNKMFYLNHKYGNVVLNHCYTESFKKAAKNIKHHLNNVIEIIFPLLLCECILAVVYLLIVILFYIIFKKSKH